MKNIAAGVRRPRSGRGRLVTRLAIAIMAATALALVLLAMTVPGPLRSTRPEAALDFAPWDGRAAGLIAQRVLIDDRTPAGYQLALDTAQRAYRRDPTAMRALTAAGLATALMGREGEAGRIFRYAETLSRRDVPTQLWLIEERVAANDISGALRHYDTALRVSEEVQPILFPILASAASDDAIAREVNRVLRTKPLWWRSFIDSALGVLNDPDALATLTRNLLDPRDEQDWPRAARLMNKLAGLSRFDLVWQTYEDVASSGNRPALIRDGLFQDARGLPPVDWDYADEGGLAPERRQREDPADGFALYLPTSSSADGEVARQLLRLGPGQYEFSADVGSTPEDPLRRPYVSIVCANDRSLRLLQSDFPETGEETRELRLAFQVPSGCGYQWISIRVRGGLDEALLAAPWIAAVRLQRH